MPFYFVRDDRLVVSRRPPAGAQPLAHLGASFLPPLVSDLHQSLRAWGTLGKRPGLLTAERAWATAEGTLVVHFEACQAPYALLHVGIAPDLATWFVLLDKWMETFVVVARARTVWTPHELATAMIFVNPMWLPRALVAQPPHNWLRVVRALAVAVAEGPLQDKPSQRRPSQRRPSNRHWQREKVSS
jgi:hypothetical protein